MIFQKLRSQVGASLIAALFLTLFCATVGAILLSAASANAGRISERSQRDHDYYEVMSAAKLFADQIRGKSVKVILTRSGGGMDVDNPYEDYKVFKISTCSGGSDKFDAFLEKAVEEIYCHPKNDKNIPVDKREEYWQKTLEKYWHNDFSAIISEKSDLKKVTITVTDEDNTLLSEIYGRIIFQGWNCVLKAMFSTKDIPDSGKLEPTEPTEPTPYVVQMTCVPKVSLGDSSDTEVKKTITFTWRENDVQIMEGR